MKKLFIYGDIELACHFRDLLREAGIPCVILPPPEGGEETPLLPGLGPLRWSPLPYPEPDHYTIPGHGGNPHYVASRQGMTSTPQAIGITHPADFHRALLLLTVFRSSGPTVSSNWVCPHCHECVPDQLLSCWQCGEFIAHAP